MKDAWSIYGLRASNDFRIRYIGKSFDPRVRLLQHLSKARGMRGPYPLYDWIKSVISGGETIEYVVLEDGAGPEWKEAERRWIALHRADLFNLSAGGGDPFIPQSSRDRARAKLKGRVFTEEWKAKISSGKRGGKRPDLIARNKENLAERNRGRKMDLTPDERARRAASVQGKGQKYWDTITDEERQRRSDLARQQMKRVWDERRRARAKTTEGGR